MLGLESICWVVEMKQEALMYWREVSQQGGAELGEAVGWERLSLCAGFEKMG